MRYSVAAATKPEWSGSDSIITSLPGAPCARWLSKGGFILTLRPQYGRNAVMDFSLTKIIEMLEERFGRTATTILAALVGFAVAAWAVRMIFDNFLMPVYLFAKFLIEAAHAGETRGTLTLFDAATIGAGASALLSLGAMTIFATFITDLFWRWWMRRTVRRLGMNPLQRLEPISDAKLVEAIELGLIDTNTAEFIRIARAKYSKPINTNPPKD